MTLDQAVELFEELRIVSDEIGYHGDWSRAPTGRRYTIVVSGGVKEEGEALPFAYHSEEAAIDAWLFAARVHAGGCRFIWWRRRPVLGRISPSRWSVYSRMAIATRLPRVKEMAA